MAFKHNLPLPALVFALIAAVLAGLVLFHTPPDEDLLRQAVDAYVGSLGGVKQMEQHGAVADIIAGDSNRLIYALFEKKDGKWSYSKNLAEEFSVAMKDPDIQRTVVRHLGEKVSQRFQASVTFNEALQTFQYDLARDVGSGDLLGTCSVNFAYPKIGDHPQRTGRYVETFEWKDGKWQSRGPGSLYDSVR
ncbi:MAG TPA: hypothetical protein VKW04_01530 [Planctomycetota bacterium]|nr:hypothetical protein [Planctomycetota bacterium]